jgi:spermidine/putrescine transport system permease protein
MATYFFLWAPIVLLIVFSFNDSASLSYWRGFSTQWYDNIFASFWGAADRNFASDLMLSSLKNSLIVAGVASLVSTIFGTAIALAIVRFPLPGKKYIQGLLILPTIVPEITHAVSLAIFFRVIFDYMQNITGEFYAPGFGTIIAGHIAFNISYVVFMVQANLHGLGTQYEEAAHDLGANRWKTFWHVTFPLIFPGILGGAMLAFTVSFDNFVMSFFNAGIGTTTLPVFVYGMLKVQVTPEVNAISTLLLIVSMILIGLSMLLQGKNSYFSS